MLYEESEAKYRKCVFAFLDILGFKNIVMSVGTDTTKAIKFIESLETIITGCINSCERYQNGKIEGMNIEYSIFSDSVCLWSYIDEDKNYSPGKYSHSYITKCYTAVISLCQIIANIQIRAIREGIIFRGAISVGQHYYQNHVTFSNALVKAYMAESTFSMYPRVIVFSFDDDFILTALLDALLSSGYVTEDDWLYIDYLRVLYPTLAFQYELIARELDIHKELIMKGLKDHEDNPHNLDKYVWLAKYHNSRLKSEYKDKEIEISNYRLSDDEDLT